jgi:hypothetical protein
MPGRILTAPATGSASERLQAVADAAHGLQRAGALAELAPQAGDRR